MPILKRSRGGHFPGHLREAFEQAVDEFHGFWPYPLTEKSRKGIADSRIAIDDWRFGIEQQFTLGETFGKLWNCTDIMPQDMCALIADFDETIRPGSTYARGARVLRREFDDIVRVSVAA